MSSKVTVEGVVKAYPPNPAGPGALSASIDLGVAQAYTGHLTGSVPVSGGPFVVNLANLSQVRFVAARSIDRTALAALITSGSNVDQVVPFSDILFLHNPAPGAAITAVKFSGTGRVEYILSGD